MSDNEAMLSLVALVALPAEDLFVSGDQFDTFRIPAICRTAKGTMLAFAEGRRSTSDQAANVLVYRRKTSRDSRWSDVSVIADENPASLNNPCVIAGRDGTVWMMYQRYPQGRSEWSVDAGYEPEKTLQNFLIISKDDGKTWSRPREFTRELRPADINTLASGPGIGIELSTKTHRGRLVIPFNQGVKGKAWDVFTAYSDDHGVTWHRGAAAPKPEGTQPNEVQIAELTDGRLILNARNQAKLHCRLESFSTDGGETWSPIRVREDLADPVCQGALLRYPGKPEMLLLSNPNSTAHRENGTVRKSLDGGATWTELLTVTTGSFQYSGLVALPKNRAGIIFETVDMVEGKERYRIRYQEFSVN